MTPPRSTSRTSDSSNISAWLRLNLQAGSQTPLTVYLSITMPSSSCRTSDSSYISVWLLLELQVWSQTPHIWLQVWPLTPLRKYSACIMYMYTVQYSACTLCLEICCALPAPGLSKTTHKHAAHSHARIERAGTGSRWTGLKDGAKDTQGFPTYSQPFRGTFVIND